jgi:hypothetical protein
MPYGTTPSRWRVYQFHHQGNIDSLAATHRESVPASRFPTKKHGADGARTRDLSSDSRVL